MVAHASNSHANGKSPAHSAFQMYFGGLEALGQTYDPFLKGLARTQLEMLGFANRRAQAYMQIPARAAQCRTPQDLIARADPVLARRLRGLHRERGPGDRHALAAFVPPNLAALTDEALANAHDYIAFPEAKEQPNGGRSRERKAA